MLYRRDTVPYGLPPMALAGSGADRTVVNLQFFIPSEALRPYFTTYYAMDIRQTGNGELEDFLHPEWANLRIVQQGKIAGGVGDVLPQVLPRVVGTGPTSLAARFRANHARVWGIGLMPLGWSRFVDASAHEFADTFCDAAADPAFSAFRSLFSAVAASGDDNVATAALIDAGLCSLLDRPWADDARVTRVHHALLDADMASVAQLCACVGMSTRSLERLTKRVFGFPPKLLLRRQRFLRSLAQYMLDPSLNWLDTMDWQYHDQAHFTRDFRRFMGMGPRQYASLDHPVLLAAAFARAQAAGAAVQALHGPGRA